MLIGGIALMIALILPWYYQSTSADGKYYEMNSLGGSLVNFLEGNALVPEYFSTAPFYLSLVLA